MLTYAFTDRTVLAPGITGAGTGVTVPVPESERQTLLAVAFRLVTSATVAVRVPRVTVTDGSGFLIAASVSGVTSAASLTTDYVFAYGANAWAGAAGAVASGPLFALPLSDGDNIVITVALIDATDQISRVRVVLAQTPIRGEG